MYTIVIKLKELLEKKSLSSEDITDILEFVNKECDRLYTVGFNVGSVLNLNPFITIDEAIEILDKLDEDDYCWEHPFDTLCEYVKDFGSPENYCTAVKDLFSTLLGNDLYNLFLNYDEDFYFDFEWDNHSDIHFLAKLHAWCSNQSSFADELLRSARNYLEHKLNNNCLETIKGILKEVPPELITDEVITQLSKYLSFYSVSNIEITKLWKTLNK